jgi:hypothetical protein
MRSAIVMLVAGAILFAITGFMFHKYWPVFQHETPPIKALVFMLAIYGALLTPVMIRRIVDPSLSMPILAWIVAGVWFIMRMFQQTTEERERQEEEERRNGPAKSSSFGKQGTGIGWAIGLTLVGIAFLVGGLGLLYVTGRKAEAAVTAKPQPKKPEVKPAVPASTSTTTFTVDIPKPKTSPIGDQPDLKSAIVQAARTGMTNDSEPSDGAKGLAAWMAKRGTWGDLAVAKNETSIELVEKDPSSARGDRLCVAGTLERIEKQSHDGVEVWSARVITASKDAVEVYAVGKTGSLAKRKPAKFCGVVTGAQRDGKTLVTFAVGMFDTNK